jgi:lipopolysaccharide/colanic/teichoic acid biosynthesis glycosyltransferase
MIIKRIVDLLFSTVGIIVLFPIVGLVAILVKTDSMGPVFYRQKRVGKNGQLFDLFKFRTMHVDADRLASITIGSRDPRITRVGYILRKYKLDELPQLFNVWRGDMSLVGPRPELKKFVDLYNSEQRKVISIKPGITDLASIRFRNESALLEGKPDPIQFYIEKIMPLKLQLNLEYIQTQSFMLDIKIIFLTIFSIFRKP